MNIRKHVSKFIKGFRYSMDLFSQLRKTNILLVDDDEWIRDSLHLFFVYEQCNLTICETSEEGLTVFNHTTFNIVICDYKLPGMNGLEFIQKIKKSHPEVKVILITAYGNTAITKKANTLGVDEIIDKPFTTIEIEKALSRVIGTIQQNKDNSYSGV